MAFLEADLGKHKYMLAMPCYDSKVMTPTVTALLSSVMHMSKLGIQFQLALLNSGTLLDASRNELAQSFLESDCDTMICLDADMVWKWEDLQTLMVCADRYPVVAGAYTIKSDIPKFYVGIQDYTPNKDGLIKIDHIGFGFVAIQKRVFEKLKPIVNKYRHHITKKEFNAFHRFSIKDGEYIGEDIYFFKKLKEAGIPAYVVPNIKLGHVGMKEYNTPFETALE